MLRDVSLVYFKSFFSLLVSILASRFLLEILGELSYGVFASMTGFILVIFFFKNALLSSVQRHIVYYKNNDRYEFFISSLVFSLILAVFIYAVLWTFTSRIISYINLPESYVEIKVIAFRILSFAAIVELLKFPFVAELVSKKKFVLFSALGIVDSMLKLLSILVMRNFLVDFNGDQLLLLWCYTVMFLSIASLLFISFFHYKVNGNFIRRLQKVKAAEIFIMIRFMRWRLLGTVSQILNAEGILLVINKVFGALVVASYSISGQLVNATGLFVGSVQQYIEPGITEKLTRTDELDDIIFFISKVMSIVVSGAVCVFFINASFLLEIWLVDVPEYTVFYAYVFLAPIILEAFSIPLWTIIIANGDIKKYQFLLFLSNLVVFLLMVWLLIWLGDMRVFYFRWITAILFLCIRLYVVSDILSLNIKKYVLNSLIYPVVKIFIVSLGLFRIMSFLPDIYRLLSSIIVIVISGFVVLGNMERNELWKRIRL